MSENKLSERKKLRLKEYDYTQNGCYFVTILAKNDKSIFSRIVRGDALIAPQIELTEIGKIVEKYILRINEVYDNISVVNYILMPNHIHLLLSFDDFGNGTMRASSLTDLSTVVRSLKTLVTKEIGHSIWHRSFYDEIIRNETHFQNTWNYIEYNALKEYTNYTQEGKK